MGEDVGDGDIIGVCDGGFGDATVRRGVAVSYFNNAFICIYMPRSDGNIDFFRMKKKGLFIKKWHIESNYNKLPPEKLLPDIKNMFSLIEEDDKKTLEDIY